MSLYSSFIFYQLIKQRLNVYGYYTLGYCFQKCYNKNIKINISIKGEQLFFHLVFGMAKSLATRCYYQGTLVELDRYDGFTFTLIFWQ